MQTLEDFSAHILHLAFFSMRLRYLSVYETAAHYYIVGCDGSQRDYYLLKLGRMEPHILVIEESDHVYNTSDIQELLATITDGSSSLF